MKRNGTAQHNAGNTFALLGTPVEPSKVSVDAPKTSVEAQNAMIESPNATVEPSHASVEPSKAWVDAPNATVESSHALVESQNAMIESQKTSVGSHGTSVESQGLAAGLLGTPVAAQSARSRRQGTLLGTNTIIARQLAAAQQAIDAVLADRELQAALAAHGYGATRMAEGKSLYDHALALQQQQRQRYGDKSRATDAQASAQAHARQVYTQHRSKARVALGADRGAAQMLGLNARLPETQAAWLLQAKQFYANALADQAALRALTSYNLTEAHLAAAQAQVAAVATGVVTQKAARTAAQTSTRTRNAAIQALNEWMRGFIVFTRIALADQPQRLAQLGLANR